MKLLLVSPHFPTLDVFQRRSDDPRSKFLYDYAVEWAKQGHQVTILHTIPKYPRVFQAAIQLGGRWSNRIWSAYARFLQPSRTVEFADYNANGIRVVRIPVSKYIPHRDVSPWAVRALMRNVEVALPVTPRSADIILADYVSPSLAVAAAFKARANIPFFQIFHRSDIPYVRRSAGIRRRLSGAAGFVYRSNPLRAALEADTLTDGKRALYMYSGIPDDISLGGIRNRVRRLLYVGTLRHSKNVQDVIRALSAPDLRATCSLDVVGDGPYRDQLVKMARTLGLGEIVAFHGAKPRDEVFGMMRRADALVMVSRETFGMVYVEAMSQGCIVVAARGEGIDGIVKDGHNGILVSPDAHNSLVAALRALVNLPERAVEAMSEQALATAASLRNSALAAALLDEMIRSI